NYHLPFREIPWHSPSLVLRRWLFLNRCFNSPRVCHFLSDAFAKIGLDINFAKSEIISLDPAITSIDELLSSTDELINDPSLSILRSTSFIRGPNFSILGSPIGTTEFSVEFVAAKLVNIRYLLEQITELD